MTAIREAELVRDPMTGFCELRNPRTAGDVWVNRNGTGVVAHSTGDYYRAWASSRENSGDATVPGHSGLAPRERVPFFARMKGFEHQGSYQNDKVKALTLYSVISIAAKAPKLP